MKCSLKTLSRPAGVTVVIAAALAVTVVSVSLAAQNAVRIQLDERRTVAESQHNALDRDHLSIYKTILQSRLAHEAGITAEAAQGVIDSSAPVVDVVALTGKVQELSSVASLNSKQIAILIEDTKTVSAKTSTAAAAEVARQAAEAARVAAAKEAAIEATRDPNSARALGASIAASSYGWGDGEFSCLNRLWTKESNWRYDAYNAGGGATGIPQSLPGSKMASFGADYLTNPETQIRWGLDYIKRSYGSPCGAWNHSVAVNWY
jgi:hypothetical protein